MTVSSSTEAHRRALEKDGYLGAINQTKLGERVPIPGDNVHLLVDTRRYSQFMITDFEAMQAYGVGTVQNPSVPVSTIKLKLFDSTGLTFFNFLMYTLRNGVRSIKGSAFYMLSIIFVGHKDDGNTETIDICNIPMVMIQMGFEFDHSGSKYDMEFVELEGNPGGAVQQLVDLSDIKSISTEGKKANTIGGMVQALEDRLNINSVRFFHKYVNESLKSQTGEDFATPLNNGRQIDRDSERRQRRSDSYVQSGKLVQYMITIPKEWENLKIDTAGKSKHIEQIFAAKTKETKEKLAAYINSAKQTTEEEKKAVAEARASYASFSYSTTIADALKLIWESSEEFLLKMSTEKLRKGEGITPKIVVNITSDDTTYLVHYDIYEQKAPKMSVEQDQVKTNIKKLTFANDKVRNLVTYDYIFSGRNSHILDFKINFAPYAAAATLDIDMNMGQNRLASNADAGQKTPDVRSASKDAEKTTSHHNPLMRQNEPVFPPTKTQDQRSHWSSTMTEEMTADDAKRNIKAKQEYHSTMAALHFMGSMESEMTIRGNPNLLRKYCDRNVRGGVPRHTLVMKTDDLKNITSDSAEAFFKNTVQSRIRDGKAEYYSTFVEPRQNMKRMGDKDAVIDGPDIATLPLFAKINIYAPKVDFLGNPQAGAMFENRFFHNGVYQIVFITHSLTNGSFTQTMRLLPWDVEGDFLKNLGK
jgi:hypothetical protein